MAVPWPPLLSPLTQHELSWLGLSRRELGLARPAWGRVGSRVVVFAANESGRWWALRLNDFPDHPLWTLFIEGRRICDIDDQPPEWGLHPFDALPVLDPREQARVLDLMKSLGPYGSEVGRPCDGDWCNCSMLTEGFVTAPAPPVGS